jgi:hypothetical protein
LLGPFELEVVAIIMVQDFVLVALQVVQEPMVMAKLDLVSLKLGVVVRPG